MDCSLPFAGNFVGIPGRSGDKPGRPHFALGVANSRGMDKQLAAATLATLIPVTLLAGYFSSAGLKSMTTSRYRLGLVYLYLLAAFAGEVSAGIGVVADHATNLEVSVAAIGAGVSTSGMFTVMAVSVREARADYLNRHQRSEPGVTDHPSP